MKTIRVLLAFLLLFMMLPACDRADAENPASDFEYEENEDGTITITSYIGTDPDVVIPAKIEGKDVTEIGTYSFLKAREFLNSVTMPNSITVVGEYAFCTCEKLTSVVLSNNLRIIKKEAFSACSSLSDIILPDSLIELDLHAFYKCSALKHINIPSNLSGWAHDAFHWCKLETVDIAEGIEAIPHSAFQENNLTEVHIPSTVKEIGSSAFEGCSNLKIVELSEGTGLCRSICVFSYGIN